jgi:hypothetical protein
MPGGSARVATSAQRLAVPLDALQPQGGTQMWQEGASGAPAERQGLPAALADGRPGDPLGVRRLERLGRSLGPRLIGMQTFHPQQLGFQRVGEALETIRPPPRASACARSRGRLPPSHAIACGRGPWQAWRGRAGGAGQGDGAQPSLPRRGGCTVKCVTGYLQ